MRKKNAYLAIVLLLLIFVGCQKKDLRDSSSHLMDNNKTILHKAGYDTTGVFDWGEYYVVEGDILIPKASLKNTKPRQVYNSSSELISLANQGNITVRIDAGMPSDGGALDWRTEVLQAIAEFNSLPNTWIRFQFVTTSTADITVTTGAFEPTFGTSMGGNTIAAAGLPVSGNAFHTIVINSNYNTAFFGTPGSSQKKYNLVHELGHCIGLRHTNWYGLQDQFGNYYERASTPVRVPGTPNTGNNPDGGSVFNGQTAANSWSGFSSWDIYAIQTLYPGPKIQGPISFYSPATYSVENLPTGATVSWASSNANYSLSGSTGSFITMEHLLPCDDVSTQLTATVSYQDSTRMLLKTVSYAACMTYRITIPDDIASNLYISYKQCGETNYTTSPLFAFEQDAEEEDSNTGTYYLYTNKGNASSIGFRYGPNGNLQYLPSIIIEEVANACY